MNVIAKIIIVILAWGGYTEMAQRIFICGNMQHANLTPDEELDSLICRTLFYDNI